MIYNSKHVYRLALLQCLDMILLNRPARFSSLPARCENKSMREKRKIELNIHTLWTAEPIQEMQNTRYI